MSHSHDMSSRSVRSSELSSKSSGSKSAERQLHSSVGSPQSMHFAQSHSRMLPLQAGHFWLVGKTVPRLMKVGARFAVGSDAREQRSGAAMRTRCSLGGHETLKRFLTRGREFRQLLEAFLRGRERH